MAITYLSGFELNHLREFNITTSSPNIAVVSSGQRSGNYALRVNSTNGGGGYITQVVKDTSGVDRSLFLAMQVYVKFNQLPTSDNVAYFGLSNCWFIHVQSDGSIKIQTYGTGAASSTSSAGAAAADGQYHKYQIDAGYNAGAGARLYIDDSLIVSQSTGTSTSAPVGSFYIGLGIVGVWSVDAYFDDLLMDDASFTSSGFPGANKILYLPPLSDSARGSWTGGAGGTTNLYDAIDNLPPAGLAVPTNTSQITNVTKGGNQDATFNITSYSSGGITSDDTVTAVMPICSDTEQISTGTKAGGVWIASNPAQTSGGLGFNFGDDGGGLYNYPTLWATHIGVVTSSPSVTLGTQPTVTVRKTTDTTRATDVCSLGIYVAYVAGTPTFTPFDPLGMMGLFG